MQGYRTLKLPTFSADAALATLAALRGHFSNERSIAFFRTSDSVGETFKPALSILGIHPSQIIQSTNGEIAIQNRKAGGSDFSIEKTSGNPFEVFTKLLLERKMLADSALPFFQGGALGYFGYDAVRFIEPVLQKTKNLAVKTERHDAEVVFFKNYILFDHARGTVTILSEDEWSEVELTKTLSELSLKIVSDSKAQMPGAYASGAYASGAHSSSTSESSASPSRATAPLPAIEALPLDAFSSAFGKEPFLEAVKKLKTHIKDGDIFQAVLSEKFRSPYRGDALDLFHALLRVNPAPYHFFFTIDGRDFMGASPEMLLKSDGMKIETHPIAGTRPRGKTPEEEKRNEAQLLASVKECAEHLMLVDLARNDIGRVAAPGSVKVESFQKLRKFGGVMHLVSKVTGLRKPELESISALSSCFPAGTLSGAPKIRAMTLLANLEPESRGFYGGAFIAASVSGNLDSCISIRSMSIENGTVTIQAGAGIVADSNAEKEYEEIQHKSRLARTALAIAIATTPASKALETVVKK